MAPLGLFLLDSQYPPRFNSGRFGGGGGPRRGGGSAEFTLTPPRGQVFHTAGFDRNKTPQGARAGVTRQVGHGGQNYGKLLMDTELDLNGLMTTPLAPGDTCDVVVADRAADAADSDDDNSPTGLLPADRPPFEAAKRKAKDEEEEEEEDEAEDEDEGGDEEEEEEADDGEDEDLDEDEDEDDEDDDFDDDDEDEEDEDEDEDEEDDEFDDPDEDDDYDDDDDDDFEDDDE